MPDTNTELLPLLRQIEAHLAVLRAKAEAEALHLSPNAKLVYRKVLDDAIAETQRVIGWAYHDAAKAEAEAARQYTLAQAGMKTLKVEIAAETERVAPKVADLSKLPDGTYGDTTVVTEVKKEI